MQYKVQGMQPNALFRVKHEQGNAFTILKNYQGNALIKMCSLVHCNLRRWCKSMSYVCARAYPSRCFLIDQVLSL